jgi:hypothetical protein
MLKLSGVAFWHCWELALVSEIRREKSRKDLISTGSFPKF